MARSREWTRPLKRAIYAVGYLLYITNLYRLLIFLGRYRKRILVYHDIEDFETPYVEGAGITLRIRAFEKQMQFLQQHYNVVRLAELIQSMEHRKRREFNVAITFDDGYKSFLQNAYPVLHEFGYPATVFLVGICTKNGNYMWRNLINYLSKTGDKSVLWDLRNSGRHSEMERTESSRGCKVRKEEDNLLEFLDSVKPKHIESALKRVTKRFSIPKADLYLTPEDCEKLSANGIDFGNHSFSHFEFSKLDEKEIEKESSPWHLGLSDKIHYTHSVLALPQGRPLTNQGVVEAKARRNGIKCVLFANGIDNGINTSLYKVGRQHLTSQKEHGIFTEMELFPLLRRIRNRMKELFASR
jgi:peptidoglycan/xylan/chitin deacetylase (PgdA/CDA1 family)